MLIWAASLMLLSPTLLYSWSFPWQITEQQFNPVGLTLVSRVCCQRELACFSFLFSSSLSPTQIYSNSFFCSSLLSSSGPGAVAEVSLAWSSSGCLCSSAFPQLLPALVPPCPHFQGLFQEQHLPSCLSFLQAQSQKMVCHLPLFNIFSPNIKHTHAYRESTCISFTLLALLLSAAQWW